MSFHSDLHVHTNISMCAPYTTRAADFIPYCQSENIKVLGFANHVYQNDEKMRELFAFGEEIEELRSTTSVKLLYGAEVETINHLPPNLSYKDSANFDYVLLAPSHILNLPYFYNSYDLSSPEKIRELTVNNFIRACSFEFAAPTGICHPLYPICTCEWEEEIVCGFSDSVLSDCFALAKKKDFSIEIHACLYRNGTRKNAKGVSEAYLHVLPAAKAEGCKFHFGSDAHHPDGFDRHGYLFTAAEELGLSEDDIWDIAR